mgnify:CR=1
MELGRIVHLSGKNQTTNEMVTCSGIADSYVENLGFPDFVEVIR